VSDGRGKVKVLSTMAFPDAWLEAVAGVSDRVEVVQVPAAHADELPAELLAEVEVMYTGACFPAPDRAPALRWVQLDTSGADHIRATDLWDHAPVTITSLAGVSPRPMAEYVMAMVLGFAHRLPTAARMRRERHWPTNEQRWELYGPLHLPGSRMLIVGYGRIGRGIARAAQAFGIEVVGLSRSGTRAYGDEVAGVRVGAIAQLDDELRAADWVVVCTPGTPETRGLIGAEQLGAVKTGAYLIDVARGGVVVESALLAALDRGRLAGAALDVFEHEPLPPSSPLWDRDAIILTPHISGLASDYQDVVRDLFMDNLERYLDGRPLVNTIDRSLGY
jgi:phosphoglycerate dehydrogenase-like enzyme